MPKALRGFPDLLQRQTRHSGHQEAAPESLGCTHLTELLGPAESRWPRSLLVRDFNNYQVTAVSVR